MKGLSANAGASILLALACACVIGPDAPKRAATDPASCAVDPEALSAALDRADRGLSRYRDSLEIPGMAVGVVCADRLEWARGYGVWALDDPTPVTARTPFRVASITKLFTATAVMALEEAGALDLDDDVAEHLSWFEIARLPDTGDAPVTIRQLLTHTSGVPRDSSLTDFGRLYQPSRRDAMLALPNQTLGSAPGEVYAYSNLGYGILGEIIAASSGTTYRVHLEREIFAPLGMGATVVHPRPDTRTAWGHGPRRPDGPRPKAGFWELGFATPAGGMVSSVTDLARFMALNLAPYTDAEPRILSEASLREMHRVQHMIDPERGGSGLSWGVDIEDGRHLVYHGGELPEQSSFLLLDLQARLGVVVLTNAQGVDTESLARELLEASRTLTPIESPKE